MKVIQFGQVQGTEREVHCPRDGFVSYRYLLAKDDMGFGLHRTVVPKGEPQRWHYTHHLEACYCVSGGGTLTNLTTGEWFTIIPGTCYVLDKHDAHTFQALDDTVLISVRSPPLQGPEVHGLDGSYEPGESFHAFGAGQ